VKGSMWIGRGRNGCGRRALGVVETKEVGTITVCVL
jgi:hypothetical protein